MVAGLIRRDLLLAGLAGCARPPGPAPVSLNLAQADAPDVAATVATGVDAIDRMTVDVRINGQGPFEFVVDTGANRTVLSEEVAALLQLPQAGLAEIHGIAGAETHATALVRLLEVDAVASRNIRAPTIPRERLGADGLLGVDVLRGRLVTFDFRRAQLRVGPAPRSLDDRTPFDARSEAVGRVDSDLGRPIAVPAEYRYGQLVIVASEVRGRRVLAFLDSGAQSTVANLQLGRLVQTLPDPHAPLSPRLQTPVLSVTGQSAVGEVGALPPLRIGGLTINGLRVVYADLHVFELWRLNRQPTLLIGIDVMRRFNALQLDFANRRVLFYPRGRLSFMPAL